MRKLTITLVFVVFLAANPTGAITSGNERPLADAGLDQRVERGTTVLLDGSGSRDPDGSIRSYRWSITTPSGTTTTPSRPGRARTRFRPVETGRYEVTLRVTDDDGGVTSDTLFVAVSPGRGPEVDLAGPRSRSVGGRGRYTADLSAGVAKLDRVVWRVDGAVVANRTLSGDQARESIGETFLRATTRTVRATVYDADGQRATDSLTVSVESPSNGKSRTVRIADRTSPTVRGPRLVTGDRPLNGRYVVETDASTGEIASISWVTVSETRGRGSRTSIDWTPGTHQLYAIVNYVDGSRNIARFSDGRTTVVADPRPRIELGRIDRFGGLSGSPRATDGYGNLRELRIEVDGETVASATVDPLRRRRAGDVLEERFDYGEIVPERHHTVTAVATDTRGQTATAEVSVVPVGPPEVVESAFVNGPVDSYHRRLDASRYAARHVTRIDLNGVDPRNVSVDHAARSRKLDRLNTGRYQRGRTYDESSDQLIVESYWAGYTPLTYVLGSEVEFRADDDQRRDSIETSAEIEVTPSDPELRYEVISDGTVRQKTDWGIVVDASRSFDPDHTDLEYIWEGGARPVSKDNATAKFSSWRLADLTIEDGNKETTRNQFNFLEFYNPGLDQVEPSVEKAYKPNETVRFRVTTEPYKLTKNRYDISLGIGINDADYELASWSATKVGEDCEIGNCGLDEIPRRMRDIDNHRFSFYSGIIEIEASELADGTADPEIRLYNEGHPERTSEVEDLPEVNVLTKGSRIWENVSVTDLEYTVERPLVESVTTQDPTAREQYLAEGYSVERTDTGTEYTLEEYVQTREARSETKTREFRQSRIRSLFVERNPEWSSGGSYTTTRRWTTTEREWRDSKGGSGAFTGRTRQVKVDGAEYRVEKRFEYDYSVRKTGTRRVSRTKRLRVRKTGTRTVTRCDRYFGCYQTVESYSYWDTEYYTYTTTESYTYTVTRTSHYWAFSRQGYDHRYTGQTRRILVDDADYATQYQYEYRADHQETTRHYEVTRRIQTQDARYEWRVRDSTTDKTYAKTLARHSEDWRIGETRVTPEWTLSKHVGTKESVVSSYRDPSNVVETRATVRGDVLQRYIDTDSDSTVLEPIGTVERSYESPTAETGREIRSEFERESYFTPAPTQSLRERIRRR